MSAALDALLREVREAAAALGRDELIGGEALSNLSERVRCAAPAVPAHRRREILEAWDALVEATATHQERLGAHLKKLGSGRRALKGYAHLRGHTRGQRLNRSV